jgi:hypothetical protein
VEHSGITGGLHELEEGSDAQGQPPLFLSRSLLDGLSGTTECSQRHNYPMRNKLYLAIGTAAVFFLLGNALHGQRSGASSRQLWEYKTINRFRDLNDEPGPLGKNPPEYGLAKDWGVSFEDGKRSPTPINMASKLPQLGDQGWELVTVYAKSNNANNDGPRSNGLALNGVTTEDLWVFKRPKPQR